MEDWKLGCKSLSELLATLVVDNHEQICFTRTEKQCQLCVHCYLITLHGLFTISVDLDK